MPPSSVGIRQPLACKNFDEGLGQCVVEEMDDPDVDCDVPVDEANCDMDQQPTDFWGQAKKCERSPLLAPLRDPGSIYVSGVRIDRSTVGFLFSPMKFPDRGIQGLTHRERRFGRSKLIDCGCEICAVSQQACADATGPFRRGR